MTDLDMQIPNAFDPFAEANADDSSIGSKQYVHVRIQQRNGRKSLTTVQGLRKEFSYNKILKDLKKEFCCNGTVVQDSRSRPSYSAARRSTKECIQLPYSSWHSEERTYQDSWLLNMHVCFRCWLVKFFLYTGQNLVTCTFG